MFSYTRSTTVSFLHVLYFPAHKMHWSIRRTVIFLLEILLKNNDECILILVNYWKKTGLLHTKISKHNIMMPDLMISKQISLSYDKDV
jgi:hypothetical protein